MKKINNKHNLKRIMFALTVLGTVCMAKQTARAEIMELNEENFPDQYLRMAIYDELTNYEAWEYPFIPFDDGTIIFDTDDVKKLMQNSENLYVTDLKGLDHLTNLEEVSLAFKNVKTVDLSKQKKLTSLNIISKDVKKVILNKKVMLEELSLDGKNPNFEKILSSLDISGLQNLSIYRATFQKIDLSECKKLKDISIFCNCKSIIVKSPELEQISIWPLSSKLDLLDIEDAKNLKYVECHDTSIKKIKIKKCKKLESISFYANKVDSCDIDCDKKYEMTISGSSKQLKISKYIGSGWSLKASDRKKVVYKNGVVTLKKNNTFATLTFYKGKKSIKVTYQIDE